MSRQHHPGILQHLPWLVLASLFVASSAKAQSDADGSLDLDLVFAIDAPTTALAGRPFDVGFDFASLLSSEGDAFELGLSMVLPADVSFVESELLGRPTRRRVDADTGETTLTFSTSRGLIPGDSLEGSMTLLAILPPGEEVPLRWLGHAGDSPFGLGAPPPGENAATFGALDLTHPTAALAGSTVSSDDDAPAGFPTTLPASDSALFTTATVRLTPFEVEVIPHVAEGERATGTGVNAYLTTIRLTGNGIDEVTGVSVEDVLSNNREFLGWDDVPAGVMVDAWANEPTAGEVMLTLSDVLIPTNGMVDVVYRSGITEYRVGDATNEHLGGAASSVAVQDGALVRDGGATPGGGEPATDDAVALTGYFQGISLPPELIPPPARAAVEAEYVAVQKGRDRKIKVIDDTVVYTLSYQVSEYLALQGPMTFTDTLPDGLVFDGAGSVTIEQSGGSTISFDVSSGTADPFHGDTEIRFTLAGGGTLPAAATGTIRYTATVDGLFEGPGNIDYECSETLTNLVRVDAVVSDEGTTDPSILGTGTADDSAATITTPEPTLEKVFVSMMDPDGVLHDGTAGTPDFDVVNEPVLPGSTLLFAVTAEFPRVPTLGVRLDDYLPLLTTSAAEIVDIRLNVDSSLVDVDGVSIATNDGDGDGFADDTMAGRRAPFDASSGGFPDTVLNNALRFELGDVPPEARFVLLIETQVTDEVPDPLPADGLVPTRNAAVLSWVDDEDVVQGTLVVNREFDIALGSVQASKSVSPSRPDAGDTARYTVRLENVGPAPAYLDDVIDTLPDGLTFVPGSVTIEDGDGVDVAASPSHELDGNELRFWFRPTGATHPSLLPAAGDVDSNVVVITYETVVASDMNPKTALVNTVRTDYFSRPDSPDSFKLGTAMDSVTLTTEEVKLAKNVISSSEPSTSGTELAIGETAVMEIEVRIPEGRMEAAVLTEVMPRGLELLSAELVSVDPRLSIGGPAELVLTDDRYSDGALDTLTVDLGEVVHPATDDDLFASIFFRVVVRTLDVSQSTNWRSWRAMTYLHDGDELEDRYGRSVRVVLPELVLTKTGDVGAVDSGDAVTYTLRLEHGPGTRADAFDIVLEEPLSSSLSLVSAGTPRTSMMLGSAPVVQGSGEPGDPVVLTIDELPIGEWVEVDVQCMVLGEIRSSTTIRNQATASFDSLPGDDAHARTFSVEDSLDIASRALGLTHALIDADHPATSGSEAVVGEVVTFRVTVDVLEGVTEDMVVDVTLPDGLVFLDEVGVRLDPSLSVARIPGVETVSGDLSWSFGDVTNHDRDNDRGEEIAIEYRAVVANVAENQVGANVVSAASVTSAAGDRGPVDAVGSVVEPLLELDAGFLVRHAQVGDVVPLSLKARHALSSGSTAHDAFIELTLPDWLTWIDPDPSGPAGMIEYDSATRLVRIELGDMTTDMGPASPMGLDLDLQLGRNPDGAVLTPTLRWSTLSGDPVMRVPGAPISTERTGSASDPGGSINDLYFSGEAALLGAHFLIGFEDLAGHPSANDFDYNDLLCRIELDESYDEDGLTRFEVTIEAMARGASFNHRLLLRLGIAGETDTTVVHRDASGGHLGTESFSNDGDVIEDLTIFESTWGAMPPNGDGPDWWSANTDVAQDETIAGWVTTVEVIVHEPERNPRIPDLAATPGIDEHVLGLLGFSLWVHGEDYEVVADGVGRNATLALLSADRFPGHALNGHPLRQFELFHGDGDWPTERTSVWTTFPDYVQHLRAGRHDRLGWAESPDPSRSWRSRRSSGLRSVSANTSSEPSIDPLSATPLLLDVDGDGVMEVIQGSFGGVITVVDPMTGAVESQFDLGQGRTSQASITGVDLDGDDIPEVVRGHEDGTVWASALDGTGRRQLAATGGPIKSTVSVGDLHEDGGVDLVFMSGDGDLWILDGAGVRAPVTTTVSSVADVGHHYFLTSTPAIADLDGEPGLEIVVGTLDGHVVALDADGVMLPGWPHDMGAPVLSSVALGDVDGDGATDVVAHDNDGRLVVLDASGTPLPGWPVQVRNGGGPSSPTLVDQDRDGEWEIVVGSLGGATWSFTPDGLVRPGWPHQAGGPVIGSPIAVDVDDDLELELVIGTFDTRVHVIDPDGSAVGTVGAGLTFPMPMGGLIVASPVAADLDDDGRVEIVVASHSGTTRVLAAPGQARRSPEWTTFRGGATRDGQPAGSLAVELCFPSIDLALRTAPAGGGDFSVTLSDVEVGCWLDVDTDVDASWFRIDAIEPEIVRYHLEPNTEISQRSVTLLLGGAEHRIVQPPCTLGLSASEIAVSSTGSGHDLDIVTEASCPWSARSDSDWLSVDRGAGSGATSLTLTTSPNDGVARTGRVSVGGAVLVVHQSATGGEADADADGIEDGVDNCPGLANSGQEDVDLNGIGDRCQVDVLVRASSDELENLASLVVALELLDGPALELVEVLLSDTLAGEACAMEHPEANRLDLSCDFADGTGPVLGLLRLVHRHDGTVVDDCGDVVLPALQADFMDGSSSLLDGVELDCQLHSGLAGDVHPSPTGDGRRDLADLVELRRHLTAGTELDTLSRSRVDLHPSRRHCERLPMAADGWESDGDGQVTADDLTVMTELVLGSRVPVVGDCESLPVVEPTERDLPGDLAPAGGDGRVDIADVVETLRVAVGFATLDEADMARVDVSPLTEDLSIIGDGQVNIADVVELLRVAVGMQEVRWPERTIDVTLEWSEAPFVAALVRVDGAPAWAELSAFELAGCPGDTAEDADIADADGTWSRLCVSDPTELTAESAFGTIRYRSREAIDPATLSVEVEMVDRLLLPVGVGLGLVASP